MGCDVVTMEIEHVGVEGLRKLEEEGVNVQPCSRVIGIIQDKFVQKVSAIALGARDSIGCVYVHEY